MTNTRDFFKKNRDHIKIRNIEFEDIDQVLKIFKDEYGEDYYDKRFYNKSYLTNFIQRRIQKNDVAWKGVFFDKVLIAQMLAIIHKFKVILLFTLTAERYKNTGIMKKLSVAMIEEIKYHNASEFKSIYAFVRNDNLPMVKILNKYGFKKLGKTPYYQKNFCFLIFGAIVYDCKWKLVSPHFKLSEKIARINFKYKLRRLLCVNLAESENLDKNKEN
ncbi:MAG: GNAT family N-acetyltransferase [Promethearchaeota archaeon]